MDLPRHRNIRKQKSTAIRPTKSLKDNEQNFIALNDDIHSIVSSIKSKFDFKSFNKDSFKQVEGV